MQASVAKISPVNTKDRQKLGIRAGDTVRVWQKIQEKEKTRLQVFEGLVLARKHGLEPGATFTVRRVTGGVGVEKIFPLYSPMIDKIEIVKRSKVRRAKLYYIREKAAKEIKRQTRRMTQMYLATMSEMEEKEKAAKVAEEEAKKAEEEKTEDEGVVDADAGSTDKGSAETSSDKIEKEEVVIEEKETKETKTQKPASNEVKEEKSPQAEKDSKESKKE